MNRRLKALICILISGFLIAGIMCSRYIRNERKSDEGFYLDAAANAAYETGKYISTGDMIHFSRAAADIIQMSNMTDSVSGIINENEAKIIKTLASVLEVNAQKLTQQAERIRSAFEIIAGGGDSAYAYAQLEIALTQCGISV